jgi:hypothetical protein
LVCLAADDSSADDSASAASTTQLFVTIFAKDSDKKLDSLLWCVA